MHTDAHKDPRIAVVLASLSRLARTLRGAFCALGPGKQERARRLYSNGNEQPIISLKWDGRRQWKAAALISSRRRFSGRKRKNRREGFHHDSSAYLPMAFEVVRLNDGERRSFSEGPALAVSVTGCAFLRRLSPRLLCWRAADFPEPGQGTNRDYDGGNGCHWLASIAALNVPGYCAAVSVAVASLLSNSVR